LEGCENGSLTDLAKSKVFFLVGDVFAQTPVIAKPILDARYADRNNRIFVCDSIPTKTSGFADKFLCCRVGTEPFVLLAIANLIAGKIKGIEIEPIAQISGVSTNLMEETAKTFSNLNPGMVISAMCFGRNENPYLLSLASQALAIKGGGEKRFLAIGEARGFKQTSGQASSFGTIYQKIKEGKIKALINWGDTFPFFYPQLDLAKFDGLVSTALFRPKNNFSGLILPCASNLEKTGIIPTLWEETKINKTLEPVSGSKTVQTIIELLSQALSVSLSRHPAEKKRGEPVTSREFYEQAREALSQKVLEPDSKTASGTLLLGEKPAIGFLNIFDKENIIKINPEDSVKFGFKENESVRVATEIGETELIVKKTNQVPKGLALVGVNRIENRGLFPMVIDKVTNDVIFPPTEVKVWQKE